MSAGTRKVTGAYIAAGAQQDITVVGFRPRSVELINKTGLVRAVWTEEMADAEAFKQVNHADTQNAFITTGGITPLVNGFRVGTDADLNTADEEMFFIAAD